MIERYNQQRSQIKESEREKGKEKGGKGEERDIESGRKRDI